MKREEFVEKANQVIKDEMPCQCSKAYTTRDLKDPTCPWHTYGEGLAELIGDVVYIPPPPPYPTCVVNEQDENMCGEKATRHIIGFQKNVRRTPTPICDEHWEKYFQRPGYVTAPIV